MNQPLRIRTGVLFAAAAAVLYGLSIPLIKQAGAKTGPAMTAALLYFGAAAGALLGKAVEGSPRTLLARHGVRLIFVALSGAVAAPILLAAGLQMLDGATASLLQNFEPIFTLLLAAIILKEPLSKRVGLAIACMLGGGAAMALESGGPGEWKLAGSTAVLGAAFFWALDNILTQPLSRLNPLEVVAGKAAMGALLSLGIALGLRQGFPPAAAAGLLVLYGFLGVGVSLACFILALRHAGAARTGSVFSLAPFVGAAAAWTMDRILPGPWGWAAIAAFGTGVWLHVTEQPAAPTETGGQQAARAD
ncbi:MAG: hypothetical protein GMKNLPBB_00983 [Myxococcota bacterium]|nr:hypothetical protein [Myxococcota bacterium]